MGGGLMQLVAYGAQDIYLTGNPQITFFKVVYRRHTNFSIETIAQTFNSDVDFGKKSQVTIARNGDLISAMHLEIKLPQLKQVQSGSTYVSWTNGIGNALIKSVSIEIGGQEIDKHYGEWLDIWGELNVKKEHRDAYDAMVGNRYVSDDSDPQDATALHPLTLYLPLRFWFNRNPGLALPLIALQYHEVKLHLDLEESNFLVRSDQTVGLPQDKDGNNVSITSCNLLVDYIYLDTDERRRFAQVSHEYLIEQLQHTGAESIDASTSNSNIDLNFNHPVKQLNWVVQNATYLTTESGPGTADTKRKNTGNQKLRYSCLANINGRFDTFQKAKIQLNGHDRMSERDSDYYRLVQNVQHMECAPSKSIYTYSFGLKPAEHQPSGTCNFSRIDNAKLNVTFDTSTASLNKDSTNTAYSGQMQNAVELKVYATNYNVLRIMSGMGGLAYSN